MVKKADLQDAEAEQPHYVELFSEWEAKFCVNLLVPRRT